LAKQYGWVFRSDHKFRYRASKDPKEGLNQTEVNFVNAQVSLDRVLKFARSYCAKYGESVY